MIDLTHKRDIAFIFNLLSKFDADVKLKITQYQKFCGLKKNALIHLKSNMDNSKRDITF